MLRRSSTEMNAGESATLKPSIIAMRSRRHPITKIPI
jgi:hypothetical protein